MRAFILNFKRVFFALTIFCFVFCVEAGARAGGGGGHSSGGSHSSGSSHSGGSSYSNYSGGGGGSMGGGGLIIALIIIVVIVVVVYPYLKKSGLLESGASTPVLQSKPFPEGLDDNKVQTSFIDIQQAWQNKDLSKVRKWISDGVYQRYTAQFLMMKKLSQVNKLSNINISDIQVANTGVDGNYQTADIAISFSMDDAFVSDKYPVFNEEFSGDTDTEYWTFIKRNDARTDKNLYNNDNCPNCGAPFDTKMGEISRCVGCGTLTNNASYDWVLSEITQAEDYNGSVGLAQNAALHELTKNDALFSVQRIEDVASNVFMQIMEVLTGGDPKKLTRFADKLTIAKILEQKASMANYVFDRLYLNDVTLRNFKTEAEKLNLHFDLTINYRRVEIGNRLRFIDDDFVTHQVALVLSKNITALKTPVKETVYSYECPSCGAPYTDTTNEACNYCGEPVSDPSNNWVLTDFEGL